MLFKRRKKTNQQEENTQKIIKQESAEFQVVDACEQMIDAAREFEAAQGRVCAGYKLSYGYRAYGKYGGSGQKARVRCRRKHSTA